MRRVVHISITGAAEDSPLPYFRGKGVLEHDVMSSGLSYAIIRPTVIFGIEDVLINNVAWALRRFPMFAVFGDGTYRIQPVFVEDLADLAVGAGQSTESRVIDAVGPETYTFEELVRLIAGTVGSRSKIVHLPPAIGLFLTRLVGYAVGDVILTRGEVQGLIAGLLVSQGPPTCRTGLRDWLDQNASTLGARYASELARHYR